MLFRSQGHFVPTGEKERIEELMTFVSHLKLRTHLFANTRSNYYPVAAFLPKERDRLLAQIQHVLDTVPESEMAAYRASLKSLGD